MNPDLLSQKHYRKIQRYIHFLKENPNSSLINLQAYITYITLRDKHLRKAIYAAANKNVINISMTLISTTISKVYPIQE